MPLYPFSKLALAHSDEASELYKAERIALTLDVIAAHKNYVQQQPYLDLAVSLTKSWQWLGSGEARYLNFRRPSRIEWRHLSSRPILNRHGMLIPMRDRLGKLAKFSGGTTNTSLHFHFYETYGYRILVTLDVTAKTFGILLIRRICVHPSRADTLRDYLENYY